MKPPRILLIPITMLAMLISGCQKGGQQSGVSSPSEQDSSSESTSSSSYTPKDELDVDPFDRTYTKLESNSVYVRKVENLKDGNFIMGMDASSVIAQEAAGMKYYDFDNQEADVFKVLSDAGINYIRVRVWNDPYDADGHGYGGGNNDLATAIAIGKRATQYQMSLLVDFHYSDFWADPSRQNAPKAWAEMFTDEKAEALYTFTKDSLQAMKDENIKVGMVQIGNETNSGKIAGSVGFSDFVTLANKGSKAVREVFPDALVALHFANPEKTNNYLDWANRIKNVDYDVFGTSYYPYWHGTLDNLSNVLSQIAETYDKYTMVMETSYAYTATDFDGGGNTIGEGSGYDIKNYPFTPHGQINSTIDIIDTIKNRTTNGIGVCYWEGTWNAIGDVTKGATWEQNQAKWQQYGCGWASTYASSYDDVAPTEYAGGTMVDNQAFFDSDGKPLETLKLWNLVRFGNEIDKFVDGVEDVNIIHYDSEDFTLPETVNVVYCDNSKAPIAVEWEPFDIEAAKAAGNARYTIAGVAGGKTVYCNLTIMEYNYVQNYSFEDGLSPWQVTVDKGDKTYIKITNENPQTGKGVFHFWDSQNTGVKFHVEQTVDAKAGTYKLQASYLGGGNTGDPLPTTTQNNTIYVKINGTVAFSQKFNMVNWNAGFKDVLLKGIKVNNGDTVVVGFEIDIATAACWGGVDDVMFNRSAE